MRTSLPNNDNKNTESRYYIPNRDIFWNMHDQEHMVYCYGVNQQLVAAKRYPLLENKMSFIIIVFFFSEPKCTISKPQFGI